MALITLLVYFLLLLLISRSKSKKADNDAFFRADRSSPWPLVAFGMIGASVSGVSLVSVPGMVGVSQMCYLQMCFGFFVGYLAIASVLLPLYYRLRLTSIYAYLELRFGKRAHKTGVCFFFLSKLTGAAARLYLACLVLQEFVAAPAGIPFPATVVAVLLLIWLYTRRSGLYSIVRTDAVQTFCMLLAIGLILAAAAHALRLDVGGMAKEIAESPLSRVFCWEPAHKQYFWKQFLSGVFVTIVMTGLDQDMMQKNLSCRTLRDAQKNMCIYGACFVPVNLLLLSLGILLHSLCAARGIAVPEAGDRLLPMLVETGALGQLVVIPFTIGVVAAAFSSADSAMTALTTSFCVDLLGTERKGMSTERANRVRKLTHLGVATAFLVCILAIYQVGSKSIIDAIYIIASYTYGPLLGLYAFGLATRRRVHDRWVPLVAIASPLLCALLAYLAPRLWGYSFGYELLMVNGLFTATGLLLISRRGTAG